MLLQNLDVLTALLFRAGFYQHVNFKNDHFAFSLDRFMMSRPPPSTAERLESLFRKPVAGMAVVINAVFLLKFLNVAEGRLRVRPNAIVRMQQHLLKTTVHAHAFV